MGEKEAIQRVLAGDSDAYRVVVERYHPGLIRYIYGIVFDEDLAHDIAQDAFISAYQNLHQYKPQYAFSTWLYRIARNLALKQATAEKKKVEFDPETADDRESSGDALDRAMSATAVRKAVEGLKPDYRSAVQLYYWEGKSYEEIAEVMDRPVNTIRTWLHRAKEELRSQLA